MQKDTATIEQLALQYQGKKALIIGDHPFSGHTATCLEARTTAIGAGLVFRSDIEIEFFVFYPRVHLMWIEQCRQG